MADQIEADDEVLPFDNSDLHEGMGPIERIVGLCGHTDAPGVSSDGRCKWCGYDRATYQSHTEVESWSITCRECDAELARVE